MELVNSTSIKKAKQIDIFNRYAEQINQSSSRMVLNYDGFMNILKDSTDHFNCENNRSVNGNVSGSGSGSRSGSGSGSGSRSGQTVFTDHKHNLNNIPLDSMGLIFFTIDEQNKGYLTLQDWLHFNNLLENYNYHYIILYEFFQKIDSKKSKYLQSISYSNKFLTFDSLLIDLDILKKSLNLINKSTGGNSTEKFQKVCKLDWNSLKWIEDMSINQYSSKFLSLNGLITLIQTDLKNYKTKYYFDCYKKSIKDKSKDEKKNNSIRTTTHNNYQYSINRDDLVEILRLQYSHKINNIIFQSIDLSNSHLIKCTNDNIPYNVYLDFIYLFDNFDILNQTLLNYCKGKNLKLNDLLDLKDLKNENLTKNNFIKILNENTYNKVNNIMGFSPSQINILFSIVANAKTVELNNYFNNQLEQQELEQQELEQQENYLREQRDHIVNNIKGEETAKEEKAEEFINENFRQNDLLESTRDESLKLFNNNYHDLMEESTSNSSYTNSKFIKYLLDKMLISKIDKPHDSTAINTYPLNHLNLHDFFKIVNPNYLNDLVHNLEIQQNDLYLKNYHQIQSNFFFYPIFDNISNFLIGSISGIIGSTIVYPIDIIKTRMQAQANNSLYKTYLDCFWKTIKYEGVKGLYSGIKPQLIGVAPEKAIKLTVNDYMKSFFQNYRNTKTLHPLEEVISGAVAGACQVVFTNPLEMVKIRLQLMNQNVAAAATAVAASAVATAGTEATVQTKTSALEIVKKLGLKGMYKGSIACMARDVPFSAIYFPTYSYVKKTLFNYDPSVTTITTTTTTTTRSTSSTTTTSTAMDIKHSNACKGTLNTWELLISGAVAGMPAAYLTTPFDVIKTRLQMDSKLQNNQNIHKYRNFLQTATLIWKEESFRSFFKGGAARVLRSSPQFGFTLAAYEIFQSMLPQNNKSSDQTPVNSNTGFSPANKKGKVLDHSTSFNDTDYYYKSCNIVKTFIDLDPSFNEFNHETYEKFSKFQNSENSK